MRIVSVFLLTVSLIAQTTENQSNARLGWNQSEYALNPVSLSGPVSFQQLTSYQVDGAVWGQPLYVPALIIGGTPHNVLFAATMHNSIYAFDADQPGSAALWHAGPLAPSSTTFSGLVAIGPEIGCSGAMVADVPNGKLYALCVSSAPIWTLYQINMLTGATMASVTVTATLPGSGDPSGGDNVSAGNLTFSPQFAWARAGLTLANGNVYTTFSGWLHPWHGWMMAYSTSTLTQVGAFCTTPNGYGGGIWHSGGGPAVDSAGNLYAATGDGTFDGSSDYAMTLLKLSPTLAVLDWFTPSNYAALTAADADMSSGRPMLPPGTNLAVIGFKDFNVYSVNTTCMGHVGGTAGGCSAPQIVPTGSGTPGQQTGIYGGAFANGIGYFSNTNGSLYALSMSGSTWSPTPLAIAGTYPFPGALPVASGDGGFGDVVWALSFASPAFGATIPATLHALDPRTLREFWNSGTSLGAIPNFAAPIIANGRAYIGTPSGIAVYGMASTNGANILLSTNGANNTIQSRLNLVAGSNVTLVSDALGNVTVSSTGGAGGSGALTQIAQQTLSAAASSVTFAVPSGYSGVKLTIVARGTASANQEPVSLNYNGDAGANYQFEYVGNAVGTQTSQTGAFVGNFPAASTSALDYGTVSVEIPGYSSSTWWKSGTSLNNAITPSQQAYMVGHTWLSSAPITQIAVGIGSGSFAPGSVFTLYGYQ